MKRHPATQLPECNEGPDAAAKFDFTMSKLLSVSHDELMQREAEYQKRSLANSTRRGSAPGVLNHKPRPKKRRA